MPAARTRDFPLFPLGIVALPGERVPLHIFEERYKTMIARCMEFERGDERRSFGILWLAEQELKNIGCACEVESILERLEDERLNILVRGTRPLRVIERQEDFAFPAGVVEFLADDGSEDSAAAVRRARPLPRTGAARHRTRARRRGARGDGRVRHRRDRRVSG